MSEFDYDLFVIGAGSGGVRASRMAASFGARVAVAEERYLGGTCVNVGCVPKKLFSYAAHYGEDFENAKGFGWQADSPQFNWQTLRDNKNTEIKRLNQIYGRLLENYNVELINGRATITSAHTVEVSGKSYSAAKILIAVGGWPFIPEFPGNELAISSNEIFYLDELPKRAVVVGGGYIAVEFAGILNGLGVKTEQIYRRDLFLRGFDTETRQQLKTEMLKKGVALRFNDNVESITGSADGSLQLSLTSGKNIETDLVLYATGRRPLTTDLFSPDLNIRCNDNGVIAVDAFFQTSVPSIFALGDVTGGMELTPVATAEAMAFARNEFNNERVAVDYDNIPTAIFSQPNVATVGLSEEIAREKHGDDISIFTTDFKHLKHTLSGDEERTFMKLVVQKSTDKVIGAHMLGSDAGEIIQGIAIAIKAGATKKDFDSTIGIHPTAAEEFVTMREVTR